MARTCCLAALDPADVPLLSAALEGAGELALHIRTDLDVGELRRLRPDILIVDVDRLDADPLEMLRQLRFVLPECTMAVYTAVTTPNWGRACHMAGANCLLSKASRQSELVSGLRSVMRSGCYTDPRFAA
jgi:DNA-binding NarL/FixJ family response regulator